MPGIKKRQMSRLENMYAVLILFVDFPTSKRSFLVNSPLAKGTYPKEKSEENNITIVNANS